MSGVEPWFEGRPVVIIAGGPSVTLRDIHLIARKRLDLGSKWRVIAVNDAVYPAWWADWLHACDANWWHWHIQRVAHFAGIKTTLDPSVPREWAWLLDNTGNEGFDPSPRNCRTGGNSAYQAMHCAIHAGASKIVLVGVDMDKGSHWFGEHPKEANVDRATAMLPAFPTLVPTLKARGIEVLNASLRSRLEIFPKVELEQAMT